MISDAYRDLLDGSEATAIIKGDPDKFGRIGRLWFAFIPSVLPGMFSVPPVVIVINNCISP
ncbi:MAG UNVERIFIED_CONTAM: hypothetical protein LVR29_18405 [Microcystis novacekii LVE1205-3]